MQAHTGIRGKIPGLALVATADGCIVEANPSGWRFVERWRRENGKQELSRWLVDLLERMESNSCFPADACVQLVGGLCYRLQASLLPRGAQEERRPLFRIDGGEMVVDAGLARSSVPQTWRLNVRETEVLELRALGMGYAAIAASLGLRLMQVMEIGERAKRKRRE